MSDSNTATAEYEARYLRARLAFIARGTSMHAWSVENGIAMQNARAALLGLWRGPKADALVARVLDAAEDPQK